MVSCDPPIMEVYAKMVDAVLGGELRWVSRTVRNKSSNYHRHEEA